MIWFCATGKSGIGHLRRSANIAGALRRIAPGQTVGLVTNASLAGLEPGDQAAFSRIEVAERAGFAERLATLDRGPVVVDTAVIPGLETTARPLALVLRETPQDRVARFQMDGRAWDLCIVPNPADHWMPDAGPGFARRIAAAGWIYRTAGHPPARQGEAPVRVLVATGGGGTRETALSLKAEIDPVLATARAAARTGFTVVQAIGPRMDPEGRLDQADTAIDPGGALNREFSAADVVISTAGYNSVLELALTDRPTLLIAIPRSIDDQMARARLWGPRLGACHEPGGHEASGAWLADRIDAVRPRPPWKLGPSGEEAAARLILGLTG